MKLKYLVSLTALVGMVSCTVTSEHNPLPTAIATLIPATETALMYSDESLAEAMMQVYPDDGSIDYKVVGNQLFRDGEEITFEFVDIATDSIANLTTEGWDDIKSPNSVFRAFVACEYEHCQPRLFVENLVNSHIFEVTFSMRMPWRPLGKLAWIDDNILAFSQSSNPHYGFRFAIDANQRKHLLTLVLADECLISGDCGG